MPRWERSSACHRYALATRSKLCCFVRELPDPKDASKKYTTTGFDMFRIEDGKIAEHWDAAPKQ